VKRQEAGGELTRYFSEFVNAKLPSAKDTQQWVEDLKERKPLPESFLRGNPFGLVAMNGNVWEIVSDDWHDNYDERAPENNERSWKDNPSDANVFEKPPYVLRGGSFNTDAYMTQCFYRKSEVFSFAGNEQIGFRIVMELDETN